MAGAFSAPSTIEGGPDPTPCTALLLTMQDMALMTNGRVSHRGQTSLPAELRHRWGLDSGGDVSFLDLGDAALIIPGDGRLARAELHRVLGDRYEIGISAIGDPDLSD